MFKGTEEGNTATVIGAGVEVAGDVKAEGEVTVLGTVRGSIQTAGHVEVEEGAMVEANVHAGNLHVAGTIQGNVEVNGKLETVTTENAQLKAKVDEHEAKERQAQFEGEVAELIEAELPKTARTETFSKLCIQLGPDNMETIQQMVAERKEAFKDIEENEGNSKETGGTSTLKKTKEAKSDDDELDQWRQAKGRKAS